jgi:hypothetical protein
MTVFGFSAIFVAGCSDKMGPTGADYTLVAIDGHPVPASLDYIDGSFTVESGSLHLDSDGYAIRILRVSESGMITRPEHPEVSYYRTLIETPEIRLIPVSCGAACVVEQIGQISGSTITLTLATPYIGSVYTYQLASSM